METSLHRSLKSQYADSDADTEVRFGQYRIDAVRDGMFIEVQCAPLASIRDKIRDLSSQQPVRIIKPVVGRRYIVRQDTATGPIVSRRLSPKRGTILELFDELVYWTRVFPHPNVILEVPIIDVEEWRLPPQRSKRRRRWKQAFTVKDVVLLQTNDTTVFRTAIDLIHVVRLTHLKQPFDTAELAKHLGVARFKAQRIAYVLRQMGAIEMTGKRGNALEYALAIQPQKNCFLRKIA